MPLNKTDILYASLLGSKAIKQVPNITLVQNELMKHVSSPFKILPTISQDINVNSVNGEARDDVWQSDRPLSEEDQFFPLSFSIDDGNTYFLLPYEPLISIEGKNEIIRRKVAKSTNSNGITVSGTVKERWNQDDFTITITGALYGSVMTGDVSQCYPVDDFIKLMDLLTAPKSIKVKCPPLELMGINQIVIEDYSFPFTKGENVQAYEIKAYSDKDYKLLLDIND